MMTPLLILGTAGVAGVGGWFSARYAWWRPPAPWSRPRVLMYHMVREHRAGARFNKLRVPPAMFARQVEWLRREGFTFVFASRLYRDEPPPERSVCITFDDGFADNLLEADPVLEANGACATLYLVEDRSGGWSSKKKSHHEDDELASEPKLTDDHVRQMVASGRWELGGHSRTHAHLPSIGDEEAEDEIAGPRAAFRERFGAEPATFAYPFGVFEPRHERMVERAGFKGAMTTEPAVDPWPIPEPMRSSRIKVSGKDNMLAFRMRIRAGKRGWKK